jgi:hypothetical protein
MHGVIGRVSPDYLRDPLIKTHGEAAGAGGHVCIGEGVEKSRIWWWKRVLQPVKKSTLPSFEPGARVVRHELTDPLRELLSLQEPAAIERMHSLADEPLRVPDVVEPCGRNKIGGFVGLEDRGSLFRFPSHALRVRDALGQTSEKLASKVLSGCGRFSHHRHASAALATIKLARGSVPLVTSFSTASSHDRGVDADTLKEDADRLPISVVSRFVSVMTA